MRRQRRRRRLGISDEDLKKINENKDIGDDFANTSKKT